MYRSGRDLQRRLQWLFADNAGADTADLELILDPPEGSQGQQPVVIPTHRCILVGI